MAGTSTNARATASTSGAGAQGLSHVLDLTNETASTRENEHSTLIHRISTTVVTRPAPTTKPTEPTTFTPQDPTTKRRLDHPNSLPPPSNKATSSPYGLPFINGVGFHDDNSKKDGGKRKGSLGHGQNGAGRVMGNALAGAGLSTVKIPRKKDGQTETNPNDVARLANEKKANERMAVLNENRDWQHQSKGNYQPVIPAGRGGGTGRGGKQLGAMRGKGQGNGQGSTKTTQSKIQDFVSTSTSTTTTNPNAIDVKVKGKSREIVLGSSSEESEEEIDEIEESPDPPPTKSTRSRGLIPAATIKPRTKYVQVEEEEEGLESTEVKKRNSKGGIREGKVREMVGEIDAKAIDAQAVKERSAPHLAPLGGPDDSFDSILPASIPTKPPPKSSKHQTISSIPLKYYRFGNQSLTPEYKDYTHSLILNLASSPVVLTLMRRGSDGNQTEFSFKATEIFSIEPPAEYDQFVTLQFVCKGDSAGYKAMIKDHKLNIEGPKSIRLFFPQPPKDNMDLKEKFIDPLEASKGKTGITFGKIGLVGQKNHWSEFFEEFNELPSPSLPTPSTSTSNRRPSAPYTFGPSTTAPTSKSVAPTYPSKDEFTSMTTPTSRFYGEAVHGTRSAGKAAEKRFEEAVFASAPLGDTTFDAPVENPEEIALVWPRDVKGAFSLTRGDLARLNEHQYLNDTLIELGLKRITNNIQSTKPELAESIHVFNSFFYQKLSMKGVKTDRRISKAPPPFTSISENYKTVRRWTQKVDLFSKKYIVVPINEHYHWYLAIIVNPGAVLKEVVEPFSDLGGTRAQTRHSLGGAIESPSKSTPPPLAAIAGPTTSMEMDLDIDTPVVEGGLVEEGGEEGKGREIYSPPSAQTSIQSRSLVAPDLESSDSGDDPAIVAASLSATKFPGKGKRMRDDAESIVGVEVGVEEGEGEGEVGGAAEVLNGLAEATGDSVMEDVGPIAGPSNSIASLVSSPALSNDVCYIFTFDSLGSPHKPVINKLRDYLAEEANDKKQITKSSVKLIVGKAVKVPQQPNTADCGFYLLHYTERFFTNNLGGPEEMTRYSIAKPKGKLEEQTREMNINWDRPTVLLKRKAMRDSFQLESIEWLEWREPFKKLEEEEAAAKKERRKRERLDAEDPEFAKAVEASLIGAGAGAGGAAMVASGSGGIGLGKKRKSAEVEAGGSTEMKEGGSGSRKRSEGLEEDAMMDPGRKLRKSTLASTATTTKSVEEITIDDDDDLTSSPAKASSRATSAKATPLAKIAPPAPTTTTSTSDETTSSSAAPLPLPDSLEVHPSTTQRPPRRRSAPAPLLTVESQHAPMELDAPSPATFASVVILPSHPLLDSQNPARAQSSPPAAMKSTYFTPTASTSTSTTRSILHPIPPPSAKSLLLPSGELTHPPDLAKELFSSPTKSHPIVNPSSNLGAGVSIEIDSQGSSTTEEEPPTRREYKKQKVDNGSKKDLFGILGAANNTASSTTTGNGNGKGMGGMGNGNGSRRTSGAGEFLGMKISGQATRLTPKAPELSIKGSGAPGGRGREEESQDDDVLIVEPVVPAREMRSRDAAAEGVGEVEEVLQDGQGKPGRRSGRT